MSAEHTADSDDAQSQTQKKKQNISHTGNLLREEKKN